MYFYFVQAAPPAPLPYFLLYEDPERISTAYLENISFKIERQEKLNLDNMQ
jgi:hypothetical protein